MILCLLTRGRYHSTLQSKQCIFIATPTDPYSFQKTLKNVSTRWFESLLCHLNEPDIREQKGAHGGDRVYIVYRYTLALA